MNVIAFLVSLPDLDERVAKRAAVGGANRSRQVGDFSNGRSQGILDPDKIVVRVEGELVGIEGTFSLTGCFCQGFGEEAGGCPECRCPEDAVAKEFPPTGKKRRVRVHGARFSVPR